MLLSLFERIKSVLGIKPRNTEPVQPAAPYKVEPQPPMVEPTPAVIDTYQPVEQVAEPAKCGCGRSPTGYCVGLHKLTQEEWAVHPDNPVKPAPEPKPKRARKNGKFAGDDKLTVEVNEAWQGGKAPAKKPKAKKEAPAAKKLKVVKADKPARKGKTSEK